MAIHATDVVADPAGFAATCSCGWRSSGTRHHHKAVDLADAHNPHRHDSGDKTIAVSNDELVSVRDAMRGLNRMVARLDSGEAEKYVLMKHGRMVAVVLPLSAIGGSE